MVRVVKLMIASRIKMTMARTNVMAVKEKCDGCEENS